MQERRLLVSFSGGETSAFMTKWILDNWKDRYDDVQVVFANTGQENEETLEFVDRCDDEFGFNVTWVESVVDPELGKGTTHRVVDFFTADREGHVFESVIQKYGIPNSSFPHCTRELKLKPITSFCRSIGWKSGTYDTAIGIRVDEIDRMSAKKDEYRFLYPLVSEVPMTKPDVNTWWRNQEFRLELKGYEGNCKWCWKKTLRKHYTLAKQSLSVYDFPMEMEDKYPSAGRGEGRRVFFRSNRDTRDVLLGSLCDFEEFHDDSTVYNTELDAPGGTCTEQCDAFSNDSDLEQVGF